MDFEIDDDLSKELLGNHINFENDDIIGNSPDMMLQQTLDVQLEEDSSEKELFQLEELQSANYSSPTGEEPYIGQEFDSESAAHEFYTNYATRVGFVVRVSKLNRSRRDGSAIGRALVCNKEGFRVPDRRQKVVRQRVETRVGCRAMMLVRKIDSGKWVVSKFVNEHTHALNPGKVRRDLSSNQFPTEHEKIRELTHQLAVEKKKVAKYKMHLEMIFERIEEHNQSLSKKIEGIVKSVREMEAKEVMGC